MQYLNLIAATFSSFAAIYTIGKIPKWFTALLWALVILNVCLFLKHL